MEPKRVFLQVDCLDHFLSRRSVGRSVYLSVGLESVVWQNGSLYLDAIWVVTGVKQSLILRYLTLERQTDRQQTRRLLNKALTL